MTNLCGDAALRDIIELASVDDRAALSRLAALLGDFPGDPRLSFLQGSILVSAGRLIEGYRAMEAAVAMAPTFAIARFQLGFLQLTSGEAEKAVATWAPLATQATEPYLRKFKDGLEALIRDDFAGAVEALHAGIALNGENEPLNRDMQLIIEECQKIMAGAGKGGPQDADTATSLLLRQQVVKQPTRH